MCLQEAHSRRGILIVRLLFLLCILVRVRAYYVTLAENKEKFTLKYASKEEEITSSVYSRHIKAIKGFKVMNFLTGGAAFIWNAFYPIMTRCIRCTAYIYRSYKYVQYLTLFFFLPR